MATIWRGGFLRDVANDGLMLVVSTTGATWSSGFLRAPTGELVVKFV